MTAARGRAGRPPLTEERKAEIRLEIARAAVELFVAQGVAATTGEQIGQAVGVSARTVWRYFPTKESCVRPLFSTGIDAIAAALRQWGAGQPLEAAFDHLWAADVALPGPDVGALLRLTRGEPGLRAVWLQTHDEAEPVFASALAERAGLPDDDVRPAIWAAMLNAALRAAVERHAYRTAEPATDTATARTDLATTLRTALAAVAAGLG
ncbi:TetR/AcrR family transcriptional regulator [Streptomyces parvulus]|uniref:TetR family transcriptional regulator n=1 Tax=Streptomyces parvulus TaxID=146923 RepID=A0A191V6R6_9ACTN|nr:MULTISPECIES: TetR/AcrR family transcriptional regulator [Streptomyces]ANJ10709.1 TetR family transcriptional regulator [Streptomyces parvulus]MCC9155454.1 TetR/AcrR family transcriptional regulator [Streptomyces parvulus]MCE7687708.1 TetR/AcrR family transcriptional regulator [Streptomyces parvulus]MZD53636.1 TetR family transcriptional regulator [Streptomyces sp. SID5606]GGR92822.1 TetR family transcriptional regulator [Streptomyces parvulus]